MLLISSQNFENKKVIRWYQWNCNKNAN